MSDLIFDEEEKRYSDVLKSRGTQTLNMPTAQMDEEEATYSNVIKDRVAKRDELLRQSLLQSVGNNPDQMAQIEALSKQTGIPQPVVERNLAQIITQKRTQDLQEAARFSPILAEQLSNPEFAKLAHDDFSSLSTLEQVVTKGRDYAGSLGKGAVGNTLGGTLSGFGELYGVGVRQLENMLDQVLPNSVMSFLRTPIPWYLAPEQVLKRPGKELKEFGELMGAPKERQGLDTDVLEGIGQLGSQIIVHLLTAGTASTPMLYGQGADIMSEKTAKDNALDWQRDSAIVSGGAITALTERYGLDKILNRVPPEIRNRTLRFLADKAAAFGIEFAQELTEGLLHDMTRRLFTKEDAPLLEGALREGTAAGLAAAIVRTAVGVRSYRNASQQEEFFKALADNSANSKLRERLPERFQDLMKALSERGPIENIYIPAAEFRTYFQSQGMDPAAMAEQFGAKNYTEAASNNSDIVIPIDEFATKVAPTDYLQGLQQDLRMSQGDMTAREFAAYKAEEEARVQEIIERAKEIQGEAQTPAQTTIAQQMAEQLAATGYETRTAEAYATIYAKTITNLAERSGQDPMALHERYSLTVTRPLPEVLTKKTQADIYLDPLLDRLRTADFPTDAQIFGTSLVEFIRQSGGIQAYGELTDADYDNRPFQRNLIQAQGMTADRAAEMAVEAGYFPDISMEQITEADLFDALDEELRGGQARFSTFNEDSNLATLRDQLMQLDEYLRALDIDIMAIRDNVEVRRLIDQASQDPAIAEVAGELYQAAQTYFQQLQARAQSEYDAVVAQYQDTEEWLRAPNGNRSNLSERQWVQVRTPSFKAWFGDWEALARSGRTVWQDATNSVSKIVDDNGEPLVVYHGTDNSGFMEFNQPGGQQRGNLGIFTTSNRSMAASYIHRGRAKDVAFGELSENDLTDPRQADGVGGIYESFLNIRNPDESDFDGANWNGRLDNPYFELKDADGEYLEQRVETLEEAEQAVEDGRAASFEEVTDVGMTTDMVVRDAFRYGNDGAIIRNVADDGGGNSLYAGEPSDVYVAFSPNQIKSADQNIGTFGTDTDNILFQDDQEVRNLVALHNLSVENLEFVDRIGGIPAPSLGITKVDSGFDGFGEITLIGPRDMIDPARGVPVFSADAYTARFPDLIWKKVPSKKAEAFLDKFRADARATDDVGSGTSMVWDYLVNNANRDKATTEFARSKFAMHAFLREKGIAFEMPMRKPSWRFQWSNDPEIRAIVEADKSVPSKIDEQASVYMRSNGEEGPGPELVEFSRVVRGAIDRYLTQDEQGKLLVEALGLDEARAAAATSWGIKGDWVNSDEPVSWKVVEHIQSDVKKGTALEPDDYKAGEILRAETQKFGDEYTKWAANQVRPLFDEPKIKIGNKQVPMTLDNIVEAMTSRAVRNKEQTMTFSSGQVSAATAKRFMSIEEIQAARDRVVSPQQEKEMKESVDEVLESYRMAAIEYFSYRDYRGNIDTWAGLDAAMKSLADAHKKGGGEQSIRRALYANGFKGFDEDVVEQAREAILAMRSAVTDYFEAKPQRAVMLNEFVGAVVPQNASAETVEILERNGLRVERYTQENRQQAVANLARALDAESGGVLFQGQGQDDKRGFIRFGKDRKFNITLLEKADLSTFIHESGHFYLEVLGDLAEMPDAPEQIRQDYATVLKFLGATTRADITLDGKKPGSEEYNRAVEMHEKFARANEAYMMEGKAPSSELREIFRRFRNWLVQIYKSMTALNVELTPEVREVFDRLYATDQEIEAAKNEMAVDPLFLDATAAGMTEAEFEAYKQSVATATETGKEALQLKLMRELQREREAWWKEELAKVREEVAAEVDAVPVYQAFKALTTGDIKFSKDALIERYGAEYLKRLPRSTQRVYALENGLDPDSVAQLLGFVSGDVLIEQLASMRPRNEYIKAEADRRMKERHGDMLLDGTVSDEAKLAMHNAQRERVLMAELRALRRKQREVAPFVKVERDKAKAERQAARAATQIPPAEAFRAAADNMVGQTAIRDLEPQRYLNAQRRNAKLAFNAMAKGDYQSAADAKQKEILNHYMYLAAMKARERADKIAAHMRKLDKTSSRERIGKAGKTYLDQIDAIMDGYEFRRMPFKQLDRRASLQAFVAAEEAAGNPVNIPVSLLEDARQINYRSLNIDELEAIYEAVRNIENLARLKNKLTLIAEKRTLDEVAGDAIEHLRANAKGGNTKKLETGLPGEALGRTLSSFMLIHRKFASLFKQMDGWKEGGMLWDLFVRPLNSRADFEAVQRAAATKKMRELFKAYRDTNMFSKKYMPALGQSISHMGRLMVALNWGRAENRQRLMDGNGFTQAQVDEILGSLEERDWTFVKGMWEFFDSYWPQIADQYERLYGVPPTKSDALPFDTKYGTMPGGYFPIKYDATKSERATTYDADDIANQMKSGAYMRSQTKNGFTKEVLQNVDRAVRLDFSTIYEHLDEVIHDLALREYLLDVNKLLNHRVDGTTLKDAIFEAYGDQFYLQIRDALKDIAVGDIGAKGGFEQSMSHLRNGVTIVGMGWNLVTGLMQPLGLTQSIVRVGPKWIAKGIMKWGTDTVHLNNSARIIYEKSDFMRTRNLTQNREINEIRNQIKRQGRLPLAKELYGMVEDSYFQLIIQFQKVVDIPTWFGAYEKALDEGASEERAVALADQAVIDAQGGGSIKDLSAVQRGGPLMKLWTTFYSYFNTTYNLTVESVGRTKFKDPISVGRLAVDVLMLYTVPAILGVALREGVNLLVGGEEPDEEELIEKLIREQVSYALGTMVGLREISGFISRPEFGYTGPAGARFFAEAYKLAKQINQGELDEALAKAANNVAGIIFHYPAGQVQRTVQGIAALQDGEGTPASVVFGAPKQ